MTSPTRSPFRVPTSSPSSSNDPIGRGISNPSYIAAASIGSVLGFFGLWYLWYLFWYLPWHKKETPTCCGREIDASCSHGAVRACKASCKVCCKSCCKSCCHRKSANNDDKDDHDHHERSVDEDEEDDDDSVTSTPSCCDRCCSHGRCSLRESFVSYWQQRSLKHRQSKPFPSPSPSPSPTTSPSYRNETSYHHDHPVSNELDGLANDCQSNFPVKTDRALSRLDTMGVEEHSKFTTLSYNMDTQHTVEIPPTHDPREGKHGDAIINHHHVRTNLGSPRGTLV